MIYPKTKLMSYSNLFDSGFKQRNKDHFAAIVRIAMDDGIVTNEEKAFLDRLALQLEISAEEYADILKNYSTHPINPPVTTEQRVERLFDLARMVFADKIRDESEVLILTKIAIGLGYTNNTSEVVERALKAVSDESIDFESFRSKILG